MARATRHPNRGTPTPNTHPGDTHGAPRAGGREKQTNPYAQRLTAQAMLEPNWQYSCSWTAWHIHITSKDP